MIFPSRRRKRYQDPSGQKLIKLQLATGRETVIAASDEPQDAVSKHGSEHLKQSLNTDPLEPQYGTVFTKVQITAPIAEFDEYGAELQKDARVWKAYVHETDKYDMELAQEWNDSTEVILIFAALFSAISTAFLIESSKLLQEDSAEVSKETLIFISQTLRAVANGIRDPASMHSNPSPSVEANANFSPSRAAVVVNILWYLSLGLSLATSFIAMMAKDWRHSFISGRTGHPFSQACRRQRKWDMIEHWGMRELLSLLPSLMHTALLLFAIGLGIRLWDVHIAVAIPIIIVTSAAFGFYVFASIGAIMLDYFPYPTMVSRLWRSSGIVRQLFGYAAWLPLAFASYPPLQLLFGFMLWTLELIGCLVYWCTAIPLQMVRTPFERIESLLDFWDQSLSAGGYLLLQVVVLPPLSFVRLFICHPIIGITRLFFNIPAWYSSVILPIGNPIVVSCLASAHTWRDLNAKSAAPGDSHASEQNENVIGCALGWLITNCEVPQSVDIALQAIAGATNRISPQPLLDCNATLEIFRRLASSNLHHGPSAQANKVVSLYARALTFLGNSVDSSLDGSKQTKMNTLEGSIWDLHIEAEKRVATLLVNGNFEITPSNLEALRIGSTAASTSLKMIKQDSETHTDMTLDSIGKLLSCHFSGGQALHDAALLSLINAAALLYLLAVESPSTSTLPSVYLRIFESCYRSPTPQAKLMTGLVIACMLWSNSIADQDLRGLDSRYRSGQAVRGYIELYSQDKVALNVVLAFGLQALLTSQSTYLIESMDSQWREIALKHAASGLHDFYDDLRAAAPEGILSKLQVDAIFCYLQVFRDIDNLLPIGPPSSCLLFFALSVMYDSARSTHVSLRDSSNELLNTCRFPTLSGMLVWVLEERHIIRDIETILVDPSSDKFLATSQLWLLFTLYLDTADDMAEERERLGVQLRRYDKNNSWNANDYHRLLGEQLEQLWDSPPVLFLLGKVGAIWSARIMECVYESRNAQVPEKVRDCLRDVPKELRGLASFTTWRPRAEPLTSTADLVFVQRATERNDTLLDSGIMEGETANVGGRETARTDEKRINQANGAESNRNGMANDGRNTASGNITRVPMEHGEAGDISLSRDQDCVPEHTGEAPGREPHVAVDIHTAGNVFK